MGVTRSRSWSITRSRAFRDCPRGGFFRYFGTGESEEDDLRRLSPLVTHPIAAGLVVDYVVARAMADWRDRAELRSSLADAGVRMMRNVIARSPHLCDRIRRGEVLDRRTRRTAPPLATDYVGVEMGREHEDQMVDRVANCLERWDRGEVWAVLRGIGTKAWAPIPTVDMKEAPWFLAFGRTVRIYSNYDVALTHEGTVTVIDVKSGRQTDKAALECGEQLGLYAWWAKQHYKVDLGAVKVQAVWLSEEPVSWSPRPVRMDEVESAAERARHEVRDEREKTVEVVHRGATAWRASREAFPPSPTVQRCLGCHALTLCPEGRREMAHVVGSQGRA